MHLPGTEMGIDYGLMRARGRAKMVLCPVAVAVGCKKCPVFNLCPAKAIIGDYNKEEQPDHALNGDKGHLAKTTRKK